MTVSVLTKEYANSPTIVRDSAVFSPDTEKIDFRAQGRQVRIKFEMNVVGGNYEMGSAMVDIREGDVRQ